MCGPILLDILSDKNVMCMNPMSGLLRKIHHVGSNPLLCILASAASAWPLKLSANSFRRCKWHEVPTTNVLESHCGVTGQFIPPWGISGTMTLQSHQGRFEQDTFNPASENLRNSGAIRESRRSLTRTTILTPCHHSRYLHTSHGQCQRSPVYACFQRWTRKMFHQCSKCNFSRWLCFSVEGVQCRSELPRRLQSPISYPG